MYHVPLQRAADIAIRTIRDYLEGQNMIEEVTMVCFDPGTLAAYQAALEKHA